VTLNDSISLPGIEDNLARLSGSSVFSGVEGAGAYHCVGVHKADRPKTAFSTPFGLWQWDVYCSRALRFLPLDGAVVPTLSLLLENIKARENAI
jgi:hypothetical protein